VAISLVAGRPEINAMKTVAGPRGSRLAEGSSRTRIEGRHARTPARQTRFPLPEAQGGAVARSAASSRVNPSQALEGEAARLEPPHAQVQRAERHVFDHGRAEELIVRILKHQSHPARRDFRGVPRG